MFEKIESLIELGNFEYSADAQNYSAADAQNYSAADAQNYCDAGADNYDGYS
jgi:hypothetical protein